MSARTVRDLLCTACVLVATALAGCEDDRKANGPPLAVLSLSPASGVTPLEVTLDGSGSTDPENRIVSYTWDCGDGMAHAGAAATHTFERPGEFTVTLTVVDHRGKTSTASQVVSVENRPPVAAFTATPESGPASLTVALDATESTDPDGSIVRYEWEFSDGATASGPTVEQRFEAPGEFGVTLRVVDDFGARASISSGITVEELVAYQMTDLGALGGLQSAGLYVNERGDVAGEVLLNACNTTWDCNWHVFLYTNGEMMDIGTLGGSSARALDLNNLGQITGKSSTEMGVSHAFLYSNGEMIDLTPFDEPVPVARDWFMMPPSEGVAINDRGEIVGNARALWLSDVTHLIDCQGGFRWSENAVEYVAYAGWSYERCQDGSVRFINESGSMVIDRQKAGPAGELVNFSTLLLKDLTMVWLGSGDVIAWATDLNDRDSVVGTYRDIYTQRHGAFLHRNGEYMELTTHESGESGFRPTALNELGQIAGVAPGLDGNIHAHLYSDGALIDLGTLGGAESNAFDLNDAGEVTGWAMIENGDVHAFVYSDGQMIDLGTLGGCCSKAGAINNNGQVTGYASDVEGQGRAFLAAPIRLLLERLEDEISTANTDAVLAQRAEAAAAAYSAREGGLTCSALAQLRVRVMEIRDSGLGDGQATRWFNKSQEISDALRCR